MQIDPNKQELARLEESLLDPDLGPDNGLELRHARQETVEQELIPFPPRKRPFTPPCACMQQVTEVNGEEECKAPGQRAALFKTIHSLGEI